MSATIKLLFHIGITLITWASFIVTVLSQCDRNKFCSINNVCDVYQTESHCFFVYNRTHTWAEADVLCRSHGAVLAEIYDVTTFNIFKHVNKYTWLNSKPRDLHQWTYLRNNEVVIVDSSTLDSWQTHCGVLVQESRRNQDGSRTNKIWLTTRSCTEKMQFLCRKTSECSLAGDDCVKVIKEEKSWYEARQHCNSTGGDLMWVNAGEVIDRINSLLQSDGAAMYFVGFTKRLWKWLSSQTDVVYSNWWYQDPNDSVAPSVCLHTYPSGFWGDASCGNYMHPACMIEKSKLGGESVTPTEKTSASTSQRTTPTRRTTTPLYITDRTNEPTTTITETTTGGKTPTGTLYPTTPSTADTTAFSTTALTPLSTSFSYDQSEGDTNDSGAPRGGRDSRDGGAISPSNPNNDSNPPGDLVTSAVDNDSKDDVTTATNIEAVEPVASKSTVLSYGVIAGVVVGITVSATCLMAAVAVVIHSRNKARRRLTQNLPTYSGDTCRSFVFDNVVDPSPAQNVNPNAQLQSQNIKSPRTSSKSIPLHYQNVSLTTDSMDSSRALTTQEKFKERRKHTYVNLFGKTNRTFNC